MKALRFSGVFWFIFFQVTASIYGQDWLYRKNLPAQSIILVSSDQNKITYKIPGDSTGVTFMMSREVIDSIIRDDGSSLYFNKAEVLSPDLIKRNYIGFDLLESFFGPVSGNEQKVNRFHFSYEHLNSSGTRGLRAELFLNFRSNPPDLPWEGNWTFWEPNWLFGYGAYNYFVKAGITYYPYNTSLVRTGRIRFVTGPSVIMGTIYKGDPYMYDSVAEKVFTVFFTWDADARLYVTDYLQLKAGLDMSVIPFLVFCCPELSINIGF